MRLRIISSVILGIFLIALMSYILGNTKLDASSLLQDDSSLTVETQFPNANCQKKLSASFPFVTFSCVQQDSVITSLLPEKTKTDLSTEPY